MLLPGNRPKMITCYLRYVIDPYKTADFESYARMWIPLVEKLGGTHHGYFLPHEGANNIAVALFSFPSLAEYEQYRAQMAQDPECKAAYEHADRTRCIFSYERSLCDLFFADCRSSAVLSLAVRGAGENGRIAHFALRNPSGFRRDCRRSRSSRARRR